MIDLEEHENEKEKQDNSIVNRKLIVNFDDMGKIDCNMAMMLPLSFGAQVDQLNIMNGGVSKPFYYK